MTFALVAADKFFFWGGDALGVRSW